MTEKNLNNIEKLILDYKEWVKRFEEATIDEHGEFSWGMEDWRHWGIDITDGIREIFHTLKALGILYKSAGDLLYEDLEEEQYTELNKVDDNGGYFL
jgi:hypothetical protein